MVRRFLVLSIFLAVFSVNLTRAQGYVGLGVGYDYEGLRSGAMTSVEAGFFRQEENQREFGLRLELGIHNLDISRYEVGFDVLIGPPLSFEFDSIYFFTGYGFQGSQVRENYVSSGVRSGLLAIIPVEGGFSVLVEGIAGFGFTLPSEDTLAPLVLPLPEFGVSVGLAYRWQ